MVPRGGHSGELKSNNATFRKVREHIADFGDTSCRRHFQVLERSTSGPDRE